MMALLFATLAAVATVPASAQVMTPGKYVMTAGASDLFERDSANVVLQTTANAQVRDFARAMLKAHSESTAMVKAAAAKSKVAVSPPMLTPDQQQMLTQLRSVSGTDRDQLYISQQKAAHQQALEVQQAYAKSGTAAPLRMTAAKIVPVVQSHIKMLAGM
jgi:putative membrane protein